MNAVNPYESLRQQGQVDPQVHKGILAAAVKSLGFTVVAIVVGFGIVRGSADGPVLFPVR